MGGARRAEPEGDREVTVTLSRWGNSLAVRIPKDALDAANLHEGDRLHVVHEEGHLVLLPEGAVPSLDDLIAQITPENLHAPMFERIIGSEVW